jgi:hypothetical protein
VEEGGGQAGMVEHELAVVVAMMAREGVAGQGGGLEHHLGAKVWIERSG